MNNSISSEQLREALKNKSIQMVKGRLVTTQTTLNSLIEEATTDDHTSKDTKPSSKEKKVYIEDNGVLEEIRKVYAEKKIIYIPGNTPSLKSSREIQQMFTGKSACCKAPYQKIGIKHYKCTRCNNDCKLETRPKLGYSPTVVKYMKEVEDYFNQYRDHYFTLISDFEAPYGVGLYFIRDSHREFDYNNASHIIMDLMKDHGWIHDDSSSWVVPIFLGFHHNQETAGCIIYPFSKEKLLQSRKIILNGIF